ncbi:MAG: Asp-tRNA(Asn)/Glu-tRNA(Gln) amidotransferase subunit GatB [Polyangia bacterium]
MIFEAQIGLEIHARLSSRTKIFCRCRSRHDAPPNTDVCPVCLGLPGALPMPNRRAVELAVRAGASLGCRIEPRSSFDRKSYFYADLPKGYQITQRERPLCGAGRLELDGANGRRTVRIARLHVEEDSAKSVHDESEGVTLLDFNRCGVPLAEIVTEPDLRSPGEAALCARQVRRTLRWAGACEGKMERGDLRFDANVSLRARGSSRPGTPVEIKNLNSFTHLRAALGYELERQRALLENGGEVRRETRLWDEGERATAAMRSKQGSYEYRYFPEPDLPELVLEDDWIRRIVDSLPEPPGARERRFVAELGIAGRDAERLTESRELADYFEKAARICAEPRRAAGFVLEVVLRDARPSAEGMDWPLPAERVGELLAMVGRGEISHFAAKSVFAEARRGDRSLREIVAELGLGLISDEAELAGLCRRLLEEHPTRANLYRAGKRGLLDFFVGRAMRATRGAADPKRVAEMLRRMLDE